MVALYVLVLVIWLTLFVHAIYSLRLLLYAWEKPERLRERGVPASLLPPGLSFTLLIPARHEEDVISETIQCIADLDYPQDLFEVIVICEHTDRGTIRAATDRIRRLSSPRVQVVTFDDGPVNKPHGLNKGLAVAQGDVVAVFDAEDDVQPGLLRVVNTIMLNEGADVVQGGVQLMNHESRWFSALNCLEYFFWFGSRLHHDASAGAVPLGGNTVFVKRSVLQQAGGWDDHCLTEDAELGMRLSVLGHGVRVFYDPELATREETPTTVQALIRQRTRWHQGFLQILKKGDWLRLPGLRRKLTALHTLGYPFANAFAALLWPVAVIMIVFVKLPDPVAMATLLPLYALALQCVAWVVGYSHFTKLYNLRLRPSRVVVMVLGFVPYALLLALSSIRAVWRELTGQRGWEKTEHTGAHRSRLTNGRLGLPEAILVGPPEWLLVQKTQHTGAQQRRVTRGLLGPPEMALVEPPESLSVPNPEHNGAHRSCVLADRLGLPEVALVEPPAPFSTLPRSSEPDG